MRNGNIGRERQATGGETLESGRRHAGEGLIETIKVIVSALLIAFGIRTVLFEPFNIPSESMLPTLLIGDYLFVSKFAYGYSRHSIIFSPPLFDGRILSDSPERGDVAVFKLPRDDNTDYIKRIIGLPGDRIRMQDGRLSINGETVARERVEDFVLKESPNTVCLQRFERVHEDGQSYCHYPRYRETLPNGVSYDTLDLDPLSMNLNRDLGYTYLFAGEYERALAQFAKANELYPEDRFAHFLRGLVHLLRDEYEPMEAAFETARTAAAGKDPYLALCLAAGRAIAAARQGRTARARELADQLEALDQPRALAALLATVHHALGDDDRAFRWLERAYEARDPWLCHLKVWPVAEATRRDPRFQGLLRRLNLPRDE